MTRIFLMGAGKIGETIAAMLLDSGDYHVTIADYSADALESCPDADGLTKLQIDASDTAALTAALAGHYAVLSASPYSLNKYIAEAAKAAKVHYFDLTEDVASTRLAKSLAEDSDTVFMPQCGLAPGFISIVANSMADSFERVRSIAMRVGALPRYPSNALKYNLTWSTAGLVNEYCNPCEAIAHGRKTEMPPLEELENFTIDGTEYEAFNTSGGLGTLCETYAGKVDFLNYRTIRYPGHRDILKLLLQDLRLQERKDLCQEIFEHALPTTSQDVVVIFVTVTGEIDGQYTQHTYARRIFGQKVMGRFFTAIQLTTASGICTALDLVHARRLPQRGFIRQEDVTMKDFTENRFSFAYSEDSSTR